MPIAERFSGARDDILVPPTRQGQWLEHREFLDSVKSNSCGQGWLVLCGVLSVALFLTQATFGGQAEPGSGHMVAVSQDTQHLTLLLLQLGPGD